MAKNPTKIRKVCIIFFVLIAIALCIYIKNSSFNSNSDFPIAINDNDSFISKTEAENIVQKEVLNVHNKYNFNDYCVKESHYMSNRTWLVICELKNGSEKNTLDSGLSVTVDDKSKELVLVKLGNTVIEDWLSENTGDGSLS